MLKYLIPVLYPRFKEEFPGWSILVQKVTEKNLTIKEVITCTGLTRRQIDYWIEKGTLSPFSRKSQKWKRFSIFDLFIFAVGYEFRVKGIDIAMLPGIRDGIPMDDPALDASDPRSVTYDGKGYLTTLSHLRLASSDNGIADITYTMLVIRNVFNKDR